MSHEGEARQVTASIDDIFAVRWCRFRPVDLVAVRAEIAAARLRSKKPLVYLSLIPASSRTLSAAEREALGDYLCSLFADCESLHHVIDGEGFVASARRSIVTNLAIECRPRLLATFGRTRDFSSAFHTHATLEAAIAAIAAHAKRPVLELLREARARGLAFSRRA